MISSRVYILVFLATSVFNYQLAVGAPSVIPTGQYDPEEASGYPGGDMILTSEQSQVFSNSNSARNGLIKETKRWPNRLVYYKIVGDFGATHRQAILNAIETLEFYTCLKFKEADETQSYYVAISSKTGGCFSAVGFQNRVQEMNLEVYPIGEGCFRPGTVLHEFMHVLGFYHEQSSSERDNFIEVKYENIISGKEFNFEKYPDTVVTDFGVGYDYDSCLHYRPGAFSINGEDTIVPFDRSAQIGQRVGLSKKDIEKINIMYKCPIKV